MSSNTHCKELNPCTDLYEPLQALLPQLEEVDTAVILTHIPRLRTRLEHLKNVFKPSVQHSIAIKSHPHIEQLRILCEQGFGLEAASIEEVRRALTAGCPTQSLVFDSPVKTRQEIAEVAQLSGTLVNVNSLQELVRIPKDSKCIVGVRVNPEIHTGSPDLFSVGRNESKFGVPLSKRNDLLQAVLMHPVKALHMHSGSQMRDLKAQQEALTRLVNLACDLNDALVQAGSERRIEILDIGGGLPSESLTDHSTMKAYAELVHSIDRMNEFKIVTEFGQWVNSECGIALSRVEYVLPGNPNKLFIHLGADMFTRDIYTQSRVFPLSLWSIEGKPTHGKKMIYDVAGPLCFAGDYIARGVELPLVEEGQWFCIDHAGANTYALWSRHCSRDVPAFWAWDGDTITQWSPRRSIDF